MPLPLGGNWFLSKQQSDGCHLCSKRSDEQNTLNDCWANIESCYITAIINTRRPPRQGTRRSTSSYFLTSFLCLSHRRRLFSTSSCGIKETAVLVSKWPKNQRLKCSLYWIKKPFSEMVTPRIIPSRTTHDEGFVAPRHRSFQPAPTIPITKPISRSEAPSNQVEY